MAELEEIWKVLNNIKGNTNKLLEENKAIREQYNELQKSLELHINKMEELAFENKDLKREVKYRTRLQSKLAAFSFFICCLLTHKSES